MNRTILVGFLMMLSPLTSDGAEQKTAARDFNAAFYAPVEITASITQHANTSALSDVDKTNLLAAKNVLGQFFRSLSKSDPNSLDYLDAVLRSKYKNYRGLIALEFNTEAILRIEIFDFNIQDEGRKIQLRYFLTDTTEGTTCEHQRAVTLQKDKYSWRISQFNKFDFKR